MAWLVSVLPAKQEVHSLILSDLTHLFQGASVAWLVSVLPAKQEVHSLILSDLTHLFQGAKEQVWLGWLVCCLLSKRSIV